MTRFGSGPLSPLSQSAHDLAELETTSVAHHSFRWMYVPGVLQTPEYARALTTGGWGGKAGGTATNCRKASDRPGHPFVPVLRPVVVGPGGGSCGPGPGPGRTDGPSGYPFRKRLKAARGTSARATAGITETCRKRRHAPRSTRSSPRSTPRTTAM
ncbi:Scr1 family TA system antitoxin-like transcriptional regulator [Streptomyces niphimycinicus]|uniref:Scr1 family TA system antitoxin-like transcriptional regulator n=1 Tax=Streptomyces niphimycinicus TaxID=2842201 RepID=UPI00263BB8F2|nr:Scr1 family TA system antitoxin-like transcriptional regulator [Streptomyces niphimycinicus]